MGMCDLDGLAMEAAGRVIAQVDLADPGRGDR
jgi:hypothetical protein